MVRRWMRGRAWVAAAIVIALLVILLVKSDLLRGDRATHERSQREQRHEPGPAPDPSRPAAHESVARTLPPPVDLDEVDQDHDLHGIVVDPDGAPVAGAELRTVTYPWRRATVLYVEERDTEVAGPSTLSASDGTFRIRLRRGQLVNLRASAAGFAPVEYDQVTAGTRLRVELSPGVRLTVTCRSEGEPLAGVKLRLFPRPRTGPWWFEPRGVTDASGSFVFAGLPGKAVVTVEAEHDVGYPGWKRVTLPESGEEALEIGIPKGRTITGRVVDAETKKPIAGARVGMGWTFFHPTTTDAEGRYTLTGWTGIGRNDIAVDAEGYAQVRREIAAETTVDFELEPGGTAKGRVLDPERSPVSDVVVAAISDRRVGGRQEVSRRYDRTATDGTFELKGLLRKATHRLILMKPGFGRALQEFIPAPDSDLGDIVLPLGRAVEGKVVDSVGDPIVRQRVSLFGPAEHRWSYGNSEERWTDHLGRFRFCDLSPGSYTVQAEQQGGSTVKRKVELGADTDERDVELRFPEGREFVVWVHEQGGAPIEAAYVSLSHGGGYAQATTDEDGRAVFQVQGDVTMVQSPWPRDGHYLSAEVVRNVPPTQSEVRFLLEKGTVVAGRVELPDGKPYVGARLEIRRGGKAISTRYADNDGRFSFSVPLTGTFDIEVTGESEPGTRGGRVITDAHAYDGELRGVAPGSEDLVLRVRKLATDSLTVRVVDPEGKPVPDVTVWTSEQQRAKTDDKGTAVLAGLPRRELKVGASAPRGGKLVASPGIEVTPVGQTIEIRLERGVLLQGTVVGPDGAPAAGVMVIVQTSRVLVGQTVTKADGTFEVYVPGAPVEPLRAWFQRQDRKTKEYWFAHAQDIDPSVELKVQLKARE